MRGKDGNKDKGTDGGAYGDIDGNNDDEAIGGNNGVCHPKQQSTNDGGKRMWMTIWGGTGGREAAKPPEAEVSAVKRPAAQREL